MRSFLESLYNGEIDPAARTVPRGREYDRLGHLLSDGMNRLQSALDAETLERLEELHDMDVRLTDMELCETFRCGVAMGAAFAAEVAALIEETCG